MTTKIEGNPLWDKGWKPKYKCGCEVIHVHITTCPLHNEGLDEQKRMIYGNETLECLNERKRYEKENLNE